MVLFSVATLSPIVLVIFTALFGGFWAYVLLLYIVALVPLLDWLIARVPKPQQGEEFPAATALSVILGIGHFLILALCVVILAEEMLSLPAGIALFLGAGFYFGQVCNANAHELIHRNNRWLRRLGMWIYISLLFGHHTSAHVLVHHVHVATRKDPNSARLGEGFYRFSARAWIGSFREGARAETARLTRVGKPVWRHPYVLYVGGAVLFLGFAFLLGWMALLCYVGLCGLAQNQLLLSDYVQHYGLKRQISDNGKAEPVSARHSWNSPHVFSAAMMLNAPRHSDHHRYPTRHYPALSLPDAPMLPRSLPAMARLALFPHRWRKVMDARARAWE